MVKQQLEAPGRDIKDSRVLHAMKSIPRHLFVPPSLRGMAYTDRPLPIGHEQTISQPYMVAFMTSALNLQPTDRVLEVGTGSGYQSAVLSLLAQEVYSIEIVAELACQAQKILSVLGCANLWIKTADGYQGWPEHAPFDAILVACAPEHVPPPLASQLKEGGRMAIPVGAPPNQILFLFEKRAGQLLRKSELQVRFVPMVGEACAGNASN